MRLQLISRCFLSIYSPMLGINLCVAWSEMVLFLCLLLCNLKLHNGNSPNSPFMKRNFPRVDYLSRLCTLNLPSLQQRRICVPSSNSANAWWFVLPPRILYSILPLVVQVVGSLSKSPSRRSIATFTLRSRDYPGPRTPTPPARVLWLCLFP